MYGHCLVLILNPREYVILTYGFCYRMSRLEKESQEKQRVGVADYFAILGVGEDLIWNHAQTKSTTEQNSAHPEEDEGMLIERFYREIVDCRIVAVEASSESLSASQGQFFLGAPSPSPSGVPSGVGTDDGKVQSGGWTVLTETEPLDIDAALGNTSVIRNPQSRKGKVYEANLDPISGLAEELQSSLEARYLEQDSRMSKPTPLKDLRRKVTSSFAQRLVLADTYQKKKFYVSYRRRAPDEFSEKAISQIQLLYARLHKVTLDGASDIRSATESAVSTSTVSQKGAAALLRVAEAGKNVVQSRILGSPQIMSQTSMDIGDLTTVALETLLELPAGYDEWSIPEPYQMLNLPSRHDSRGNAAKKSQQYDHQSTMNTSYASEAGSTVENDQSRDGISEWQDLVRPRIVAKPIEIDENYVHIPILAIRRQRVGEEERFNEDPAVVDVCVSFWDRMGEPSLPVEEIDPFEDEEIKSILLQSTEWKAAAVPVQSEVSSQYWRPPAFGTNCLLFKRNLPLGFCDATFKATVLDRFPYKNYKGLPLPEEELPMFCYPTGCHLHRARFKDAPVPQYYGFVVKNERGDSICVSCVSFMEPLTKEKKRQLGQLSERRKRASLPHANHVNLAGEIASGQTDAVVRLDEFPDMLTGFDEMTTFENKTICLVSRYPYWTAFRKFLSHLHSISCSSSDLPLERYISHLLLAVPVPKPGGPSILIPLPTLRFPMALSSPPSKNLPLVDLSYERLISCLDIPTIVAIVLGFLALEKKVCWTLLDEYSNPKMF